MKKPEVIAHSLAMKQLPNNIQSIYKTNYTKNPKAFLQDMFGFSDIKLNDDLYDESIENACISQLEEMSNYYA